ncbi:hypothetical protein [Aquimarina algiphila]|uniref:RiboL-PSP-HEPN domain-containing protein n=1 Tax=Aquimarina algiphila TaxID=2047982 RepID=A0A554VPC3_9FLAO|nr:hypothetical protein [Aquimarina algiphila]TSE10329.1 hypothetical protein FOF46_04660 [Aquimarina algiphila]
MDKKIRDFFKPTPIINLLVHFAKSNVYHEIFVFKQFIYDMDSSMKKHQNVFIEGVKDIKFQSEEEKYDFENYYEMEDEKYFNIYPKFILHSVVITLYSHLENKITSLIQMLEHHNEEDLKERLDKIKGKSDLQKYKKFLKVNFEVEYSADLWDRVNRIRLIRNSIVHDNSSLHRSKYESVKRFMLNNTKTFLINDNKFRITDSSVLIGCTEVIGDFLTQTYCQVEKKLV